jgi:hypothetical protein
MQAKPTAIIAHVDISGTGAAPTGFAVNPEIDIEALTNSAAGSSKSKQSVTRSPMIGVELGGNEMLLSKIIEHPSCGSRRAQEAEAYCRDGSQTK